MIAVDLPQINTLIELMLEDGTTHPSRVENIDDLVLSVAAPAGVHRPEVGTSAAVRWLGERGVYSASVRITAIVQDRIALWILQSDGVVEYGTRRGAVRIDVDLPVHIVDLVDESSWEGRLMDLSESGLRCHLAGRQPPKAKLKVMAAFPIDGAEVKVRGSVLRSHAGHGDEESEAVVVLHAEEKIAQQIRRYVIQRQILARRARADENY